MKLHLFLCLIALSCLASHANNSSANSGKWQTLLSALQRNPALVQQLRSNPALIRTLKDELRKKQQQKQQLLSPPPRPDSRLGRLSRKQQRLDECGALRVQNARLKQMISAVLDGEDVSAASKHHHRSQNLLSKALDQGHRSTPRAQRELNNAQLMLNRVAQENKVPTTSLSAVLVTPTPVWSTVVESSSYETTVTESLTTELPIIVRGNKVTTTIIEPTVLTVTATELKTLSTLVTPSPTWSTTTVTVTPTAVSPAAALPLPLPIVDPKPILPSLWPHQVSSQPQRAVDPRTGLEHADVLEIGRSTTPLAAKEKLDRLKQAYSIFFANSNGQFGLLSQQQPVSPNPIFAGGDDDAYDFTDQQVLAAQQRPVFVSHPQAVSVLPAKQQEQAPTEQSVAPQPVLAAEVVAATVQPEIAPEPEVEIRTIYISGKVPGEYTTSLTTVTKTASSPAKRDAARTPRRAKRNISGEDIIPTRVIPIESTVPPDFVNDVDDVENIEALLSSLLSPEDGFHEILSSRANTYSIKTVTVTVSHCQSLP